MPPIPVELLFVVPISVAAGVDLYLTLLFLGASTTMGLWEAPLPGALADLDSPGVLIMVGTMYLLEFAAERNPVTSLAWNAFHAIIRPVSGMLLALLVLDGQSLGVVVGGSALAAVLAFLAHAVRSGEAVVRWLGAVEIPSVLLVSLLEDVVVLGLVSLTLDLPRWAAGVTGVLALALAGRAPSSVRAFVFAVRLAIVRLFQTLVRRRWLATEELPDWVRASLEDDDVLAPGGALRGSSVAALRVPGAPRFLTGWVVVRGGSPVLVHRRRRRVERIELARFDVTDVAEHGFFRRVDLGGGEQPRGRLFFGLDGPSAAGLRAEFLGR